MCIKHIQILGFHFWCNCHNKATVLKGENNFSRFSNSFHFTEKKNLKRGDDVVLQAKVGLPLKVKANSEFSFSEKKGGSFGNRVMRPTIKDVIFHFSYAHSAIFSLHFRKNWKRSISFHQRNLNFLVFWVVQFFFAIYNWNNNGNFWVPCMDLGVPWKWVLGCPESGSWGALKVSIISDFFCFCFAWLRFRKFFFHSKHWQKKFVSKICFSFLVLC